MVKEFMNKIIYLVILSLLPLLSFAKNDEFGVLCYHNVVDESVKPNGPQYFSQTISTNHLIRHFNWLRDNGYTPVSWQQIQDAKQGIRELPQKAVLLTFDDGYESFYNVIYPLLKTYNYPAMYAIVTDWINTPANKKVTFGNQKLNRSSFVTWEQLREMQASGLIEIASHTHDLHHGITANPAGSSLPAVFTPEYKNGKYETVEQYRARLRKDFKRSYDLIKANVGVAPRVIIWPYGQFNDEAVEIAKQVGLEAHFSLRETKINTPTDQHIGRLLLDTETSIDTISSYLSKKPQDTRVQRTIRVELDMVYDVNPLKQKQNIDQLVERIHQYGITTVYLQAFSDLDKDGSADALYFNNKYLPVRADIFSQIAWALRTRAGVEVYAWMPVLAFNLKNANVSYVLDNNLDKPNPAYPLRLSPYNKRNVEIIKSIYSDLSLHSKFDGILFGNDAFLTNAESSNVDHETYRSVEQKTLDLVELTNQLKQVVIPFALGGKERLKTVRSVNGSFIFQPELENQWAQNLVIFRQQYDGILITAIPYIEGYGTISTNQAEKQLESLVENISSLNSKNKFIFELQTINQNNQQHIEEKELINWMESLQRNKFYSFGYSPDNFLLDKPSLKIIKPYFSLNTDIGLK